MPIVAAELIAYLAANMPKNDTDPSGGGIDTAGKIADLPLSSASTLEIISSNAGDTTQTVTVEGRDAAGAIISDTKTLNGTTAVAITGTFERVLRVVLSATAAGTVTLRVSSAGATVVALEAGFTKAHRHMYDSASEASQTIRYEKCFWKNTNGSLTLTSAKVKLTADPSANVRIGVATSVNDNVQVSNRKSAPGGVTFVDDGVEASVPGNQLAAGAAVGTWVEYTLAADEAAVKSNFTTQLLGNTV